MSASTRTPRRRLAVLAAPALAAILLLSGCTGGVTPIDGGIDPVPPPITITTTAPVGKTVACTWLGPLLGPLNPTATPARPAPVHSGRPPARVYAEGHQTLILQTNRGDIVIALDLARAPCAAASMTYLANQAYYDGSTCHRLVVALSALQCGDPTGTGGGQPEYSFADENLPTAYHAGDVAMTNTGVPDANGGQFFFVWADTPLPPRYSLFGHVTKGLDLITAVGAGGDDGAFAADVGGGHPRLRLDLQKVGTTAVTP